MHIRVLGPGDEAALEAFLRPRMATSMFFLSNMRAAGLADTGARYSGSYVAALEDEAITAIAAHFWNNVIIFQAPEHAVDLARAALAASGRALRGLIGPSAQVQAVKAAFGLDAAAVQLDRQEILYRLDLDRLQVPEPLAAGEVRARHAAPADLDLLTRWRLGYEVEALGAAPTPAQEAAVRAAMQRAIAQGDLWVLERDGEPVSTTAFNSRIAEAVQVGGVWTPPALRGRGYARSAVAASLLEARDAGARLAILFTDEENVAAQKAYAALGFAPVGDYYLFFLQEPVNPLE